MQLVHEIELLVYHHFEEMKLKSLTCYQLRTSNSVFLLIQIIIE